MENFWNKLSQQKKPFFCSAPMADVTDTAFRQILAKYGKPDVIFTEMVACDGLCSVGREKLLKILKFSEIERPIVAQLFGSKPENFYQSAQLVKELGFDGVDINMGCPQKNILKQGAGSDLINHSDLAREIIRETKRGAGGLPVSVKTRIGFNKNELDIWLPALLAEKPSAITIHGRTKKEMSKVKADWNVIKKGVEMAKGTGVLIIGNGDVQDISDGQQKGKESGVDGVMIGRAILGKPWLLHLDVGRPNPDEKEKLNILLEHLDLFEELYKNEEKGWDKNFSLMKKHMKAYLLGFRGAKELRIKLMDCESKEEAEKLIKERL
ncbi:MAG: tRNA-dihydrouridine synthase [Patescibacteria group bacterium]|nr:tRNA-dihydrouridine synthase [Patescibacteria group bacterium]